MIKIGIGGIAGAGKSALRDIFKAGGAFVVNLDEIAHGFYCRPQNDIYRLVKSKFEDRVPGLICPDMSINRKKLGEYVFNDKSALDELNSIFYKAFKEYIENLIYELETGPVKKAESDFFVLDAAVLFDSGLDSLMDYNLWVCAGKKTLISRLVKCRNIDEKYAGSIVETQLKAYAGCRERADFEVANDGSLIELEARYLKLIKEIRNNVKNS